MFTLNSITIFKILYYSMCVTDDNFANQNSG